MQLLGSFYLDFQLWEYDAKAYKGREAPAEQDHGYAHTRGNSAVILQWLANCIITVNWNEREVQNRCVTQCKISAGVKLAEEVSKIPACLQRAHHTGGHDKAAQEQVSCGHWDDQVVGGCVELLEKGDGADDPQVAEHNHNDGYSKEEV